MTQQVEIRVLTSIDELNTANDVLEQVWGSAEARVPLDMLRALTVGGGYVSGSYVADEMVGAAVGFLARANDRGPYHMHSHAVGVLAKVQGRHVGLQLKVHQQQWSAARGLEAVRWTFDPLQARNARFNMWRLGAHPVQYYANFYGMMTDDFNTGTDSDRLLVSWPVNTSPRMADVAREVDGVWDAPARLTVGARGEPVLHDAHPGHLTAVWEIPADITRQRIDSPELAQRWRLVTRELFQEALAWGASVSFLPGRGYLVTTPRHASLAPQ